MDERAGIHCDCDILECEDTQCPCPCLSLNVIKAFSANFGTSLGDMSGMALDCWEFPAHSGVRNKICDPTRWDVIIGMHQGLKAWLLLKCKVVIESVAWNPVPPPKSSPASAYPWASMCKILLGGHNGTIYEMLLDVHDDIFKMPDRYVSPIFVLMPWWQYHLPRSKNTFSFK